MGLQNLETRDNGELSDDTFFSFLGFTLSSQGPDNLLLTKLPNAFFFLSKRYCLVSHLMSDKLGLSDGRLLIASRNVIRDQKNLLITCPVVLETCTLRFSACFWPG